ITGSRKLAAAEAAIASLPSEIDPSSKIVPVQLDITDDASRAAAFRTVSEYVSGEGLDVLINNAGIGAFTTDSTNTMRDIFEVNVLGTAAITETMKPLLNKNGAIINITSSAGSFAIYSASVRKILPLGFLFWKHHIRQSPADSM
ncbi:unnamed protein product, partial [Mycena citricolor]